jgi:hypothetical protein
LRIAFRTCPDQEFLQDANIAVTSGVWRKYGWLMVPRADKDMYFFLESPAQTVLSKVQIRKLTLQEKLPGLRFDWLIRLLKLLPHREISEAG